MVFFFVALTVAVFIAIDVLLRREEQKIKNVEHLKKSPIFLNPEQALNKVGDEMKRLFHLSHTWVLPSDEGYLYVGLDNFMTTIFTSEIQIDDLPLIGTHVPQGTKIWNIKSGIRHIKQLAPVSGQVVDVNPAFGMDVPLPSNQIEKSWILKIKPDKLKDESNNLMNYKQAHMINTALKDEFYIYAQRGHYLNDGGQFDAEYLKNMSNGDWLELLQRFFPYHDNFINGG